MLIFLLFLGCALSVFGLFSILFSHNLWTNAHIPLRVRFDARAIIGFLCLFAGAAVLCWMFELI